jgi:hypothetical protein
MMVKRKTFPYKVLLATLALIATAGFLRMYQTIYQWEYLRLYFVQPGPWYILLTGALVAAGAATGLVGGWLYKKWSAKYIRWMILAITVWWWLDYLLLTRTDVAFYNLPFRILVTFVYLIFVFLALAYQERRGERMKNEE